MRWKIPAKKPCKMGIKQKYHNNFDRVMIRQIIHNGAKNEKTRFCQFWRAIPG